MSPEDAQKLWEHITMVRRQSASLNRGAAERHMDAARKLIVKHAPDWGKP